MHIHTPLGAFVLIIATGVAIATIISSSVSARDMWLLQETVSVASSGYEHTFVHIGHTVIVADIADTEKKRATGLSFKKTISPDGGMLFIFPHEERYGIWMKDMSFPIDILWISKNFHVVDINTNVSPDTYPETYYPSVPILYALETSAGFVSKHNITIGDTLSW